MIFLQYKTSRFGKLQSKHFISREKAEEWLNYNRSKVLFHEMRQITGVVTASGEVYTSFLESQRLY